MALNLPLGKFESKDALEFLQEHSTESLFKAVDSKGFEPLLSIQKLLVASIVLTIVAQAVYLTLYPSIVAIPIFVSILVFLLLITFRNNRKAKAKQSLYYDTLKTVRVLQKKQFMQAFVEHLPLSEFRSSVKRICDDEYSLTEYKETYQELRACLLNFPEIQEQMFNKYSEDSNACLLSKHAEKDTDEKLSIPQEQIVKWNKEKPFVGYFYE